MKGNHMMTCKGFTLIEILITLAISGVVLAGVYSAFKSQQDSYLAQEQVAEMQQNIRAGMDIMAHDIRMAGYDPDPSDEFEYGVVSATGSQFVFTADINDDAGLPVSDETFTYECYTTTYGVSAIRNRAGGQAIAENIDRIEFFYLLQDGTKTTSPTADQLDDIISVQISILARASKLDRNYTDNNVYTTASAAEWGPFNDNFRRRFQITTVQFRNI